MSTSDFQKADLIEANLHERSISLEEPRPNDDSEASSHKRFPEKDGDEVKPNKGSSERSGLQLPSPSRPESSKKLHYLSRSPVISSHKLSMSLTPPPVPNQSDQPINPLTEYKKLIELKSGGRYVPPAKLRALLEQINIEKGTKEYQRVQWDKLKKSINGLVNKVNKSNIRSIVADIFRNNMVRGRGLFVRSIMKAQSSSLPFTSVYASLTAIINTKLPQIGELLITRLIIQFRKAFKRNDKSTCITSTIFLAHLCNFQVAHEILVLQILHLLLEQPTDDSVEIAVGFMKEVGAFLAETSSAANNMVFERFRAILHEGQLNKRTQYMIEVLFQVRRDGYKENPIIPEDLDLVEEDDQITHMIGLDDEDLKSQDLLNIFRFDKEYETSEEKYETIKHDILGDSSEEETDEEDNRDSATSESESDIENEADPDVDTASGGVTETKIKDMTNTDMLNLRKTIYLTIKSSLTPEEATHKLLRLHLSTEHEKEIVNMVIECCSEEKTYHKLFGGIGERLCRRSKQWHELVMEAFKHYFGIIHRYSNDQIRNMATFFGYLLACDSLDWSVFEVVHINDEETTPSSRIFIQLLFDEMSREIGIREIAIRFKEDYLKPYICELFPMDDKRKTIYAINYFTAIKMGVLTEDMRDWLKNRAPTPSPSPERYSDRSRSRSYDSYSGSGHRKIYRSPGTKAISGSRSRSFTRSTSRSRSFSRGRSYTPSRSRSRSLSYSSRSHSPRRGKGLRTRNRSLSSRPRSKSRSRSRSASGSPSRLSRQERHGKRARSPLRSLSPLARASSTERARDYSPPPARPRTWQEAAIQATPKSSTKPTAATDIRGKGRARAADYL
ncbi:MIF4G-domain-containing protein [Nadsonia fulvescens var. elongata DSM 6958]|uniref:Pre-mRNA-splicing factor CWC22 n=1 Tax=Nadsonia fulvescens var. elongata DSM 6958 TaxID=857566 RepID=A0A1E3PS81_9ASCO|nr:MIF4G-domain-containing protein [Nadsonia fulvescens var. elongata DSM 6958]